jgi:hypothetical protein
MTGECLPAMMDTAESKINDAVVTVDVVRLLGKLCLTGDFTFLMTGECLSAMMDTAQSGINDPVVTPRDQVKLLGE